jgi:hypothetical protein
VQELPAADVVPRPTAAPLFEAADVEEEEREDA